MKKKVSTILIVLVLIILLFPIKSMQSDGGSVSYSAILYEVRFINKRNIGPRGGNQSLTKGTVISIFGITVYDSTETNEVDL